MLLLSPFVTTTTSIIIVNTSCSNSSIRKGTFTFDKNCSLRCNALHNNTCHPSVASKSNLPLHKSVEGRRKYSCNHNNSSTRMKLTKLDDDFFNDGINNDNNDKSDMNSSSSSSMSSVFINNNYSKDDNDRQENDDEIPNNIIKQLEEGQPSELTIMKELLGINGITYVLVGLIVFFLTMNTVLGPGWLGQMIGLEGTGTFTEISSSLPGEVDLSQPENLL